MNNADIQTNSSNGQLRRNAVGLPHIVFFVVAAAAPMTAMVGGTPPAFAFGNGAGVPGAFILAGILYLIFSIGFTTLARRVKGAGAFYTYITQGLGKPAGLAGAFMALAAYFAIQVAVYALFGVFATAEAGPLGLNLPWWLWAFIVLCIVTFCGQRNIEVSGRILGVCMIAEITVLLLLNIAIMVHAGHANAPSLSSSGFHPSEIFSKGLGVTLVFVFGSYVGFEATAIFGEEAKNPERTIPRATYVAVILITVFYAFSSWAIVQYYGAAHVQAAANKSMSDFYFSPAQALLGHWAEQLMNLLMLSSMFACLLSFHNTLTRYFFALGREGVAWRHLSSVHARHGSPHIAGWVQSALALLIILGFMIAHSDPYAVIFSWLSAVAVLGILAIQIMVSVAVIVFFRREVGAKSFWMTVIAPALAAIGLTGAFILVSVNLSLLTGSSNIIVELFPVIMLGIGVIGAILALYIRRSSPDIYTKLGESFN